MENSCISVYGLKVNLVFEKISINIADNSNYFCCADYFILKVDEVATFLVKPLENLIIIDRSPLLVNENSIFTWLYGTVMAYLLQYNDFLVLHGSAVMIEDKVVVFSGDSGAGKSTLAAIMSDRGHQLITDDVVAISRIDGALVINPGMARVKLWNDALSRLNKSSAGLQEVVNKADKFEYPVVNFYSQPVKMTHFFELNHSEDTQLIKIESKFGVDKLNLLIKNTYRYQMLDPLGKRKLHLQQVAELAKNIDAFKIMRPRSLYLLAELADMIEDVIN